MSLLDRLTGAEEPRIPAHNFSAALVGIADAQFTRAQVETFFGIGTTGTDKTQMDTIVNGYVAAADKGRYLTSLHAILIMAEMDGYTPSAADVNAWLTAAQAPY